MKIAGIPILNFIPWAIWIVGKNMDAWGWFPGFFVAMIASGIMLDHHPTHSSIHETVELMKDLNIKEGYITHLSHKIDYHENSKHLPPHINFAYDGMCLEIPASR